MLPDAESVVGRVRFQQPGQQAFLTLLSRRKGKGYTGEQGRSARRPRAWTLFSTSVVTAIVSLIANPIGLDWLQTRQKGCARARAVLSKVGLAAVDGVMFSFRIVALIFTEQYKCQRLMAAPFCTLPFAIGHWQLAIPTQAPWRQPACSLGTSVSLGRRLSSYRC